MKDHCQVLLLFSCTALNQNQQSIYLHNNHVKTFMIRIILLLLLLLLLLFTTIEFSLGGSSPYTSNK